jgi:hypothetical protein
MTTEKDKLIFKAKITFLETIQLNDSVCMVWNIRKRNSETDVQYTTNESICLFKQFAILVIETTVMCV